MNMHNLQFAIGFSMSLGYEDPSRDNSMSLDSSCRMSFEVHCLILPHAQLAIKHLLAATKAFSRPEILGMHQAGQVPGQILLPKLRLHALRASARCVCTRGRFLLAPVLPVYFSSMIQLQKNSLVLTS